MLGSGAFSEVNMLKTIKFQQSRTRNNTFISDSRFESRREASTTRATMIEAIMIGENGSQGNKRDHSQIHRDRSSEIRDHRQSEEAGYAIKRLRGDLSKENFQIGAIHLAIETEFLAKLCHPNIVTLFGVGEKNPGDTNYFLILEHLGSTLYEEIRNWKEEIKYVKLSGSSRKEVNSDLKNILTNRIDVARQISAGLMYLHEKSIIFRDLKPENIAIDSHFRVKIFDFGTAKELKPDACRGPNRFAVTGRTGTPRYMAPEVYFCECYGFPSDIFSFSLVLWEIMALETIFAHSNEIKHIQHTYIKKRRPNVGRSWPNQIQKCIRSGWLHDPSKRANIQEINDLLNAYLI